MYLENLDRLPLGPAAKDPTDASGACILVTGGAGYIGSQTVLELLDSGFRVVVLDSLVTGFRWAVDPSATFVEGCVEDGALVRRLLHDYEVRGILHFASSTIAPECVRAILSNIIATTLLRANRFLRAPSRSRYATSYFPRRPRFTAIWDLIQYPKIPCRDLRPRTGARSL